MLDVCACIASQRGTAQSPVVGGSDPRLTGVCGVRVLLQDMFSEERKAVELTKVPSEEGLACECTSPRSTSRVQS